MNTYTLHHGNNLDILPIIHARCQHATTQPQPEPTLFNND